MKPTKEQQEMTFRALRLACAARRGPTAPRTDADDPAPSPSSAVNRAIDIAGAVYRPGMKWGGAVEHAIHVAAQIGVGAAPDWVGVAAHASQVLSSECDEIHECLKKAMTALEDIEGAEEINSDTARWLLFKAAMCSAVAIGAETAALCMGERYEATKEQYPTYPQLTSTARRADWEIAKVHHDLYDHAEIYGGSWDWISGLVDEIQGVSR